MQFQFLSQEDPLEEEMAPYCSILARRTPGTEKPAGLQSTGLQESRHDLATEQQQQICLETNLPSLFQVKADLSLQMRHISEMIKWVPWSADSVWPKIKQTLRAPSFMQSDKQTKLRICAFW